MFQVDLVTIIVCVSVVVVTLALSLVSPFLRLGFRKRIDDSDVCDSDKRESLSVIMTVANGTGEIFGRQLSVFLSQRDVDFQIIVVYEKGDSLTEDVLKLNATDQRLYSTFIPCSSFGIDKKELAMTIGMKAAKHDWIVFVDSTCLPCGDNWLRSLSVFCGKGGDMVVMPVLPTEKASFSEKVERAYGACCMLGRVFRNHRFTTVGCNVAVRKDVLFAHGGFRGKMLRYFSKQKAFRVNQNDGGGVDVRVPSCGGWLIEDANVGKNRRHCLLFPTPRYVSYTLSKFAVLLTWLSAMSFSVVTQRWVALLVSCVAVILYVIIKVWLSKRAMKIVGTIENVA